MSRSIVIFPAIATVLLIAGLPLLYRSQWASRQRNFRAVEPGVLYRSGQMTPAGLARTLDEYGIRTVISFRDARTSDTPSPDEFEIDLCHPRGVAYHRLSPLRWSLPDGSVPAAANVERFIDLVNNPATPRPILVHCFAGIHRTGAFVAVYRMQFNGWSPEEALAEMLEIGLSATFESDQIDYLRSFQPIRIAKR